MHFSALETFLLMRYINRRFTYLLTLNASFSHTCASIIKQSAYNLVLTILTKRRRCSAAGKVTAGLAESNGSQNHLRADYVETGISSGTSFTVW